MTISVIIPTYNESRVIIECLESLAKQSYKDFEVVVVDDGSTDNSAKRLSQTKIRNLKLRIIKQRHLGAGAARNKGSKFAKGKILVFVDADMTFKNDFLKKLCLPILQGETKGTFSKDEYVSNWENIWARCWNINEGWEAKKRHKANYPNKQKVFRAILKSEFDRVGGFTPGGYTDDWSLSQKLGYQADVAKDAVFFHKNPENLVEIFNHAKWVGKRKYKLRIIGALFSIIRASLPFSLLAGLIKAVRSKTPLFILFKVVYNTGLTLGIIKYILTGAGGK